MNELITVVLTSYNHKEYLESAITHMLNQTYKNIELIIIDDCSTDGSQDIIKKYQSDHRVKAYLLESNLGSYVKSTNLGATYASGNYLNFAQCDDFSDIYLLEKLHDALMAHPDCGVAYSSSFLIDEHDTIIGDDYKGRTVLFKTKCGTSTDIAGQEMRRFLYQSCVIPNLSSVLIRRDLYQDVEGLSEEFLVMADWDMWFRLTYRTNFYYLRENLNYFRQHSTTIRSRISMKKQLREFFLMHQRNLIKAELAFSERLFIYYNIANIWVAFARENFHFWIRIFPYVFKWAVHLSPIVPLFLPVSLFNKILTKVSALWKY